MVGAISPIFLSGRRGSWLARYKVAKCGHYVDLGDGSELEYCPRCLERMSKQCALCGRPIFIGDAVGLYAPRNTSKVPEFGKEPYSAVPLEFVVCQRAGCAEKAEPVGVWSPPGRINFDIQLSPRNYAGGFLIKYFKRSGFML